MKKIFLLPLFLAAMLTARAADYPFLTFELTDGAAISVPASSLVLKVSGNTLTAGSQEFTLSNLSKMYFTETEVSAGVRAVGIEDTDEDAEIYDLSGRRVSKDGMTKGVYVIKSKSGICKIAVK